MSRGSWRVTIDGLECESGLSLPDARRKVRIVTQQVREETGYNGPLPFVFESQRLVTAGASYTPIRRRDDIESVRYYDAPRNSYLDYIHTRIAYFESRMPHGISVEMARMLPQKVRRSALKVPRHVPNDAERAILSNPDVPITREIPRYLLVRDGKVLWIGILRNLRLFTDSHDVHGAKIVSVDAFNSFMKANRKRA